MSKRSIRLVAAIAGASLALGGMAPAFATRIGGTDDPSTEAVQDCLSSDILPDLFPINVDVNPEHPFIGPNTATPNPVDLEGGLLDIALNDNDNIIFNSMGEGPHAGVFGPGLLGTYGVPQTLAYVLGGAIDAGLCITDQIVTCVTNAVADVFPVNVDLNPEHPFQTPDGEGGLLDVALNDNDNDAIPTNGSHAGVFGAGPLGIYGIPATVNYVGTVLGELATCLGLTLPGGPGNPLACLSGLDLFPINADVNPFRLFQNNPGLLDIALGDNDANVEPDGETFDGTHVGLLGTPLYVNDDNVILARLACVLGGVSPFGLSSITSMAGGSPLSVLGGGASPLGSVTSLAGGLTGGLLLNGSLTGILHAGPGSITTGIFASVAAVL